MQTSEVFRALNQQNQ